MPLNLGVLALPLLGGYLLISTWNRTHYRTHRYSGYRFFFAAGVAGFFLMACSYVVVLGITAAAPNFAATWHGTISFPYSGTATGAFLLGAVGGYFLNGLTYFCRHVWYDRLGKDAKPWQSIQEWLDNYRYRRQRDHRGLLREAEDAISQDGNSFELLLARAIRQKKQVVITLKTGKVYVGYVLANFNPAKEREYVSILKVFSGYRHSETREFVPTTLYEEVRSLAEVMDENLTEEDFKIVFPVSQVVSISIFDDKVYALFENLEYRTRRKEEVEEELGS